MVAVTAKPKEIELYSYDESPEGDTTALCGLCVALAAHCPSAGAKRDTWRSGALRFRHWWRRFWYNTPITNQLMNAAQPLPEVEALRGL